MSKNLIEDYQQWEDKTFGLYKDVAHTGWLEEDYCYDEELNNIVSSISIEE